MIRIGIIGDIGSGKSYVAKQFGYPVFDADDEVSKIYRKSKKCFYKLKKVLPHYIFSFPIKREELLKAILKEKKNINKINKIVHPEVRIKMRKFIKRYNKQKKIVILDIPLLLEGKMNNKKDILVFVEANKKEINKRLRKRKNYNKKIFVKLKKLQLPLEFKRKKSNFIIKNNFKSSSVKKSVKMLKKKI